MADMIDMQNYLCTQFRQQRVVIADCVRWADILFNARDNYEPLRVLPPSLGNGFGGIVVGFHQFLDKADVADVARCLHRSAMSLDTLGLMTGFGGLYPLVACLRRLGHDPNPSLDALLAELPVRDWINGSVERRGLWRALDLFDGLAGYCFGVAAFGTAEQVAGHAGHFDFFADLLEGVVARRFAYDDPTPGISHGFLGYSHALLAIYRATGERRFLELADLFRAEAHKAFGLVVCEDGLCRVDKSEGPVFSMFCNGHVGLALHESYRDSVLCDGCRITAAPLTELLLDTTYCHGVPSLLAALRSGFLYAQDPSIEATALAVMNSALDDLYAGRRCLLANMTWNYGALGLFSEAPGFTGVSLTTVMHGSLDGPVRACDAA
jgi:hypothetical protein